MQLRSILLGLSLALSITASAQALPPPQTVPAVAALPTLHMTGVARHDGADIWFGSVGSGRPVILLHGGLSSSRGWGDQVPALVKAGYRVILIDSRGHGRSTLGDRPLSYELMATDVVAVMDKLRLKRAAIVGWSDGAIIGLLVAMHHAPRVDRLYAFGANMDQQGVRSDAFAAPILGVVGPRLAADHAALSGNPQGFARLQKAVRVMQAHQPQYSAAQLATIRNVPVTIASGAHDEFITEAHAPYLAKVIPGARLEIFPNAGHFAPWQQSQAFNRAILAFLQRKSGTR
ncbi:alpha/beta fold hydrolase [Sphingomonas sp. ASY06-1R]|jgi:pimeloyl-ACP methyl ester carboxylesterase|uniref:alpha/beta fold hydrolase n=1 Tax=Sphingomonas sp. ASY06-1R TaxID=3445771 RepID=UPI003FA24897